MVRYLSIIALLFLALAPLDVAAESSETAYQKARTAYYALKDSSRKQMYRENWDKVYSMFSRVHERYPDSSRGGDALYMCGKTMAELYHVSRVPADAEQAVAQYQEMDSSYPESSLTDDALMNAGKLLEVNLGDKLRAYQVYKQIVDRYPKGDMAAGARKKLTSLASFASIAPEPEPASPMAETPAAGSQHDGESTSPKQSENTTLKSIRFWSNPGYTRIVLDLSQQTEFSAHFLAADEEKGAPPRLYVDLLPANLSDDLMEPTIVDDGLLRRIRTGKPEDGTVRVVLDLVSIGDYKVFPLGDPYRLVIDVAGEKVPELKRREPELTTRPATKDDEIAKVLEDVPKDQPELHVPVAPVSNKLRRIVVDAGHGGRDPGAVGKNGTLEKDVTLAFAKQLARTLDRQLGCEVILTRSGDVYLPLEERTAIANKVGADLFISIHANANNSRKAYGVETYYLNFSKNDKAAAVAARENNTSLKEVSDLELILFDLMANSKINESSRLAAEVQKSMVSRLDRHYSDIRDLGVRQGPFYVLLGANMPSILVETAFISNQREEKRLVNRDYQKHAAEAIADGIKKYAVANKLIASK